MERGPKISVIVPVYGVQAYLDRCVSSICKQTFEDLEVILVDDGSPDDCPAMCDAWAGRDLRIRVIHQKNAGAAAARNCGLDHARGQYYSFVDSDDYIEPDMLETLVKALETEQAQMALCNFVYEKQETDSYISPQTPQIENSVIDESAYWEGYFSPYTVYYVVPWNKLYRKELFAKVRYPEDKRRNEDEFVLQPLVAQCERIVCLNYVGYHYVQRIDSTMQSGNNKNYLDCWEVQILRAREQCSAEQVLRSEGILNTAVLNLWTRQDNWRHDPALHRRFHDAVKEAASIYAALARQTGQSSMWVRAVLLRMGLDFYIRFLRKRNPALFERMQH